MVKMISERIVSKAVIVEKNKTKLNEGVLCKVVYPICNVDIRNHNGRIYEEKVWENVENNKDIVEKLQNRCLFGHAEHPSTTQSNLEKTSHIVTRLFREPGMFEGKQIMIEKAEFDVLDTPYGRIVDTILRAGSNLGCSTRAEGELEEKIDEKTGDKYQRVIPESYKFITVDFTADPSTLNAYPESVERDIVGIVQQGIAAEKIDHDYATMLLENMKCEEAKVLCESIKKSVATVTEKKEEVKEEKKELPKVGEDIEKQMEQIYKDMLGKGIKNEDALKEIAARFQLTLEDVFGIFKQSLPTVVTDDMTNNNDPEKQLNMSKVGNVKEDKTADISYTKESKVNEAEHAFMASNYHFGKYKGEEPITADELSKMVVLGDEEKETLDIRPEDKDKVFYAADDSVDEDEKGIGIKDCYSIEKVIEEAVLGKKKKDSKVNEDFADEHGIGGLDKEDKKDDKTEEPTEDNANKLIDTDITDEMVDTLISTLVDKSIKIDKEQFKKGIAVEKEEHQDVTNGNIEIAAKIALSHLKEFPDYYTRLEIMEKPDFMDTQKVTPEVELKKEDDDKKPESSEEAAKEQSIVLTDESKDVSAVKKQLTELEICLAESKAEKEVLSVREQELIALHENSVSNLSSQLINKVKIINEKSKELQEKISSKDVEINQLKEQINKMTVNHKVEIDVLEKKFNKIMIEERNKTEITTYINTITKSSGLSLTPSHLTLLSECKTKEEVDRTLDGIRSMIIENMLHYSNSIGSVSENRQAVKESVLDKTIGSIMEHIQ